MKMKIKTKKFDILKINIVFKNKFYKNDFNY